MKRYSIALMMIFLTTAALAQKEMSISPLFKNHKKSDKVTIVKMSGKELRKYHIDFYHSISVQANPQLASEMAQAVKSDAKSPIQEKVVLKNGELIAGYYQLSPENKKNRFILFRVKDPNSATLIYLEGETELDQLVKLLLK